MKTATRQPRAKPRTGKGGRPSKAREGEIAEHILATAAAMFASQGYAATSVERVALACGAGKDTIYRRYPSKRALFDAVVERLRLKVLGRLDDIAMPDEADGLAQLRDVARWFLTVNLDPELVALKRIALSEAVIGETGARPEPPDPIFQRLVALVARVQAEGHLRRIAPAFVASQIINTIAVGPMIEAMLGRTTYATAEAQDSHFDKAWDLFLSGARAG